MTEWKENLPEPGQSNDLTSVTRGSLSKLALSLTGRLGTRIPLAESRDILPARTWKKVTVVSHNNNGILTPLGLKESGSYQGGKLETDEYVDCPATSLEEKMYLGLLIQDVMGYGDQMRIYGEAGSVIKLQECRLLLRPGGICRPFIHYIINGKPASFFGRERALSELREDYGQSMGAAFFATAKARMAELDRVGG